MFSDSAAYGAYSNVRTPEFLQYFSSTIVNLIPVIFVVIIDSTILVVELLTELENHKSSFLKNISLMLKYGMFLFSAYWVPIFILFSGMMPSLIQNGGELPFNFTSNEYLTFTFNYIGILISQFFLTRGIISKGYAIIKILVVYTFRFIIGFIKNKKFVQIDKNPFTIGIN